jgi:hypothetical protein
MNDAQPEELGVLAKVVIVLGIMLIVTGVLRYGVALATIQRLFLQLVERPSGAIAFRFILQPTMAAIAAVHDGRRDARLGRTPYFWTMLHEPRKRIGRLREGLNATARILLLGLVMDAIYQIIEFDRFYPVEAVIIALLLAFLPYVVLRGLVLRIAHRWHGGASAHRV